MHRFFLLFVFGFFHIVAVRAQVEPDTVIVLPEIEVRDSLYYDVQRSGISRRRISTDRISQWAGGSVSDLLGGESFATVRQYGAAGLSTISLRGSGGEHTLISLDGAPLIDPQSGRLDLSTVPLTFLESATVSLGPGRRIAGQGALGGTIELRSIEPTDRTLFRGTFVTGAYGKRQGGTAFSHAVGPLRTLIAVDFSGYDGNFWYEDPSSFPRQFVQRTAAERSGQNLFSRIALDDSFGDWDASVWLSKTERSLPGPSNAPPKVAEQVDRATRLRISNAHRIRNGLVAVQIAHAEVSLDYLPADSGIGRTIQKSVTRSTSLVTGVKRALSSDFLLEIESSLRYERSAIRSGKSQSSGTIDVLALSDRRSMQTSFGVAITQWKAASEAYLQLLPRLMLRLTPGGQERLLLRASAGRIFRPPTFSDRFWVPGGNPELLPEKGWAADAGVNLSSSYGLGTVGFTASIFISSLEDKIVWHPSLGGSGVQIWTPDNVGKVQGYGGETTLDLSLRLSQVVRLEAAILYTFSRSEDRTNPITRSFGRQLRYVPQEVVKARLTLVAGSVAVESFSESVSKRYTSSDERFYLSGYRTLTLRVSYGMDVAGGRIFLQLTGENLENKQIEHIRFYPLPPRHASFSLRYTFTHSDVD